MGHMLWSYYVGWRHVWGRRLLHGMVRRHRGVRALSGHDIGPGGGAEAWLGKRRLEAGVAHVWGVKLRAAVTGAGSSVRAGWRPWRWRALHWKPVGGDKRLCLGVEGLAVVASWDGVLALGVVGVDMSRQLPISIGNPGMRRRRPGPRWVGVLDKALLRPRRLRYAWHGTAVRPTDGRVGSPVRLRRRRWRWREALWREALWHRRWHRWGWVLHLG